MFWGKFFSEHQLSILWFSSVLTLPEIVPDPEGWGFSPTRLSCFPIGSHCENKIYSGNNVERAFLMVPGTISAQLMQGFSCCLGMGSCIASRFWLQATGICRNDLSGRSGCMSVSSEPPFYGHFGVDTIFFLFYCSHSLFLLSIQPRKFPLFCLLWGTDSFEHSMILNLTRQLQRSHFTSDSFWLWVDWHHPHFGSVSYKLGFLSTPPVRSAHRTWEALMYTCWFLTKDFIKHSDKYPEGELYRARHVGRCIGFSSPFQGPNPPGPLYSAV